MSVFLAAFLLSSAVYSLLFMLPEHIRVAGPRAWETPGFWFILALGLMASVLAVMEVLRAWN